MSWIGSLALLAEKEMIRHYEVRIIAFVYFPIATNVMHVMAFSF